MTKRLTAALALGLYLPVSFAPAMAEGCHDRAKMSCAEGSVWDDEKQVCAPKPAA